MDNKYKSSFIKDNLMNILGTIIIYLKAIILMPIIIKTMGVEIYGGYVLFVSLVSITNGISSLGVGVRASRHLPSTTTSEDRQKLYWPQFLFGLMAVTFFSSLLVFMNDEISLYLFENKLEYSPYIFPLFLGAFFLYTQGLYFFRFTSRIKYTTIGSTIYPYLHISIVFLILYYFDAISINALVISETLSAFLVGSVCLIKILREIKFRPQFYSFKELTKEIKVGIPLTFNVIIDFILSASDRYLISIFISISAVGYYNPAYLLGSLVLFFPKAIGVVVPQLLSKAVDAGDQKSAEAMVNIVIKVFFLFSIPFVFGSFLVSKPMLTLLSNAEVAEKGYLLTPLVSIGIIFYGLTYIMTSILFVQLRTGLMLKVNLYAAGLNLTLNIVFLYLFRDIMVAALTTIISYLVSFVYLNHKISPTWTINFNPKFILKVFGVSVVMAGVLYDLSLFVEESNSVLYLAAFILGAIVLYGSLLIVSGVYSLTDLKKLKRLIKPNNG